MLEVPKCALAYDAQVATSQLTSDRQCKTCLKQELHVEVALGGPVSSRELRGLEKRAAPPKQQARKTDDGSNPLNLENLTLTRDAGSSSSLVF